MRKSRIMLGAVAASLVGAAGSASAQSAFRVVLATGSPVEAFGPGVVVGDLTTGESSRQGGIAVSASLEGGDAASSGFIGTVELSGEVHVVALSGDTPPGAPPSDQLGFLFPLRASQAGNVLFRSLNGSLGGKAWYAGDASGARYVLPDQGLSPAPGLPDGVDIAEVVRTQGNYSAATGSKNGTPAINAIGEALFFVLLGGPGVDEDRDWATYIDRGAGPELAYYEGDVLATVPGGPTLQTTSGVERLDVGFDDLGRYVFVGELRGGGVNSDNNDVVVRGTTAADFEVLARQLDPVDAGQVGERYESFLVDGVESNGRGDVAFVARTRLGLDVSDTMMGDIGGAGLRPLVPGGSAIPGLTAGERIGDVYTKSVRLAEDGTLAAVFAVENSESADAICVVLPGGEPAVVARVPGPGSDGTQFDSFVVGSAGRVAFSIFRGGVERYYVFTPEAGPRRLFDSGEVLSVDLPGDAEPLVDAVFNAGLFIGDEYLVNISFADGTSALVAYDLTAPCGRVDLDPGFGTLDLDDINAFMSAFVESDLVADLVAPLGVVDLSDLDAFISAFLAGCP